MSCRRCRTESGCCSMRLSAISPCQSQGEGLRQAASMSSRRRMQGVSKRMAMLFVMTTDDFDRKDNAFQRNAQLFRMFFSPSNRGTQIKRQDATRCVPTSWKYDGCARKPSVIMVWLVLAHPQVFCKGMGKRITSASHTCTSMCSRAAPRCG